MREMEILSPKLKTFLTTLGKTLHKKTRTTPAIALQMSACYSISLNTSINQMIVMVSFISLLQNEKTLKPSRKRTGSWHHSHDFSKYIYTF